MPNVKPVRIYFEKIVLYVQDFTDFNEHNAQSQTVTLTVPGEDPQVITDLGFYGTTNANTNPMKITPAAANAGDVFVDGVYRLEIVQYTSNNFIFEVDERLLYIPEIDSCILKKTDTYLRSSCDNCKSTAALNLLQELVIIRQAAQLNINNQQYEEAALKVKLLTNLCTGASCACICGC